MIVTYKALIDNLMTFAVHLSAFCHIAVGSLVTQKWHDLEPTYKCNLCKYGFPRLVHYSMMSDVCRCFMSVTGDTLIAFSYFVREFPFVFVICVMYLCF